MFCVITYMIKNLIFDFGKVLVEYDYHQLIDSFFDGDVKTASEFISIILSDDFGKKVDRELVPVGQLFEELALEYPRFAKEIHLFDVRYQELMLGEMPGMYEILSEMKQRGYHLYGLTNWSSKVYETMRRYGIFRLLDGQIISSEEHLLKPEPEIYQCLFDRFHLVPEECLFTDDRAENVEGGRRMGMPGIVFTDAQQYRKELERYLA